MQQALIRNFCIIAHIDHGKSTVADRLIERCGGLSEREMSTQILDSMDIERERGITIKAQCVSLNYQAEDGQTYRFNIIDTPGHVDFAYEVSRSLSACEGSLLVVDAAQGVEAQTVAVCYHAVNEDLEVIPVLNKIDLPQAESERVMHEIEEIIGIDTSDSALISAKTGVGISELLEKIVERIPAPTGDEQAPLKALIIDSWFDNYLGVVSLIRIVDGTLKKGDAITIMSTGKSYHAEGIGQFTPKKTPCDELKTGEVGYLIAAVKDIHSAPVGDTVTHAKKAAPQPLQGFQKAKPQVYSGLFPSRSDDFLNLKDALQKLQLNDASLFYEMENSQALGFGFRCGFLGLLHMEIIQERLEREYDLDLIITAPTVVYRVTDKKGVSKMIDTPALLPDPSLIQHIEEPIAKVSIITPQEYLGAVIQLCVEKRGVQKEMSYVGNQVTLEYALPMNEIVLDFFDRIKSLSRGYASIDFAFDHFEIAPLVKLDVLINGDKVDALAMIIHQDRAQGVGRKLISKMKTLIPRQMFPIAIQASIGQRIIARETVSALRKNVTAKCYGGDITRKKKLLEKQKKGKARMKQIGQVNIPQDAFFAVLKMNEE